jgi:3-oxoacyl-[acyl-carrier-protein] synthase II
MSEDREDDVVVTGLGFVSPLGTGADAVWQAWTSGESGVRALVAGDSRLARGIDPSALPGVERAAFVRGFVPRDHIRQGHFRRMDWVSRMLVGAARQAYQDAGYDELGEDEQARAAIVVGSQFGNQRETARYTGRVFEDGLNAGSPMLFPNLVLNASAGYAAIELGFSGPNLTVSEHEASGEAALAAALDLFRSGACDLAVVGGADEFGEVYLQALAERRLLHPAVGWPRGSLRRSSGWVMPAEAGTALVLERGDRARRRGARVYGIVEEAVTVGSEALPYDLPSPSSAARALRRFVLPRGKVDAYVGVADGGRPRKAIDLACLESLAEGQGAPVRYASFREQTGETGSIGLLGVGLAALALSHGMFPDRATGSARVDRIALLGAARSGALVPLCLRRAGAAVAS